MTIVFTALHFANFRNFESVIRTLAERGHRVHLLADEREEFGGQALAERLAAAHPGVTWGWAPSPVNEPWFPVAQKLRYALDYVRFLAPRYADVPKLRLRNIKRTPRLIRWLSVLGHRPVTALLTWYERTLPTSPSVQDFFRRERPDVLLLTGLTFSRSFALEQLKAARALGIRTAACIMSWDHLSSKALLHLPPDRTLVWNPVQKTEATDMHGLEPARVVVTGAQCYDQWFDRQPTASRTAFCDRLGLEASRPFLLYVCSTMSPAPDPLEPHFVRQWILALRASDNPVLRDIGVLVRPHPERVKEWQGVSLEGIPNVAMHGRMPLDGDAKADYFDSLYHSRAVVGLCTSAFIEAAVVGRPVMTLLLPEYRMHQDGMAHFRYLTTVEGGLLHVADDMTGHLRQLTDVLAAPEGREDRNRRFLTAFVRPGGLEHAATPEFVAAVEALGAEPSPSPDPAFAADPARPSLAGRLAVAGTRGVGRWLLMDDQDYERMASEHERVEEKQAILSDRAARREAEQREREARLRAKAEQREAKARERARRERDQQWRRWRYVVGTSAPVVRVKNSLRHLLGGRPQ